MRSRLPRPALASLLLLAVGCGGPATSGRRDFGSGPFDFALGNEEDLAPPGDGGGFNKDAACAKVSAEATLIKKPVDVIFVIDNSGSMTDEIVAVQNNINKNFADIIGKSGLDYRVIMVARHGSAQSQQSVCITAPLSAHATCNPLPVLPGNTAKFYHYSVEISSTNSFSQILATYNKVDEFGLAPMGWSAWLRPDAVKVFIEITDDNSGMTAVSFEAQLFQKMPKVFGDAMNRNYIFHTIAGLKENVPATKPWLPTDPLQNSRCTKGGGAVHNGIEYQKLSQMTGGLRFPICEHQSFDAVFQEVAKGVVKGAQLACEFEIPEPPMGTKIDLATIVVEYTPSNGGPVESFQQVPDKTQCGLGLFYIENNRILLCPDTCTAVKKDDMAKMLVYFDCEAPIS